MFVCVCVQRGLNVVMWKSRGISEYLSNLLDMVVALHSQINRAKTNMRSIVSIVDSWSLKPLVHQGELETPIDMDHTMDHLRWASLVLPPAAASF